jgi:hypothetical protein
LSRAGYRYATSSLLRVAIIDPLACLTAEVVAIVVLGVDGSVAGDPGRRPARRQLLAYAVLPTSSIRNAKREKSVLCS